MRRTLYGVAAIAVVPGTEGVSPSSPSVAVPYHQAYYRAAAILSLPMPLCSYCCVYVCILFVILFYYLFALRFCLFQGTAAPELLARIVLVVPSTMS